MKALLQNAALVSVSTVLTFVALEAAYRGRVYLLEPQRFVQHDIWREPVPFFNAPFSTFNKRISTIRPIASSSSRQLPAGSASVAARYGRTRPAHGATGRRLLGRRPRSRFSSLATR